jgi:signal recognition particle GTPase
MVVGVNGGKTTTIGKLAFQFKAGYKVVLGAGDTAAIDQLQFGLIE